MMTGKHMQEQIQQVGGPPVPTLTMVLGRMIELLNGGWCQCNFARAADGRLRESIDPDAQSFCLVGALKRATWELCGGFNPTQRSLFDIANERLKREAVRRGWLPSVDWSLTRFNDAEDCTLEEILSVVEVVRAEAAAEAEANERVLEARR